MNTFYTDNTSEKNINIEEIKAKLEGELSPRRFIHSLNVMKTAKELAKIYTPYDMERAAVAGLLHDCARDLGNTETIKFCDIHQIIYDDTMILQTELLHAPVGAKIAEIKYGINDYEIINAIKVHTIGKENMNMLEKIIFVADYIEPNRNYPRVLEVREIANRDIDKAALLIFERTINYLLSKGALIHTDAVLARNFLIKKNNHNGGAV